MTNSHKISFFAAVLMNINLMIGAGIFLMPELMAEKSGAASFLGWALSAIIFLPIVMSIAHAAKLFPGAGSFYSYSKDTLGKTAGFLSGWTYILGWVGIISVQMFGLRQVLGKYFSFSPLIFNLLFLTFLCIISSINLKAVSKIQSNITLFKLSPLILVIAFLVFYLNPKFCITAHDFKSIGLTIPMALFGFWGFEGCCSISHLIKGDKNAASRAIIVGFFATALIYSLFHFGLIHIMGTQNLGTYGVSSFVNYLGFNSTLQTAMNALISSAIMTAYISSAFGAFIANSEIIHAMSKENLIFGSKEIKKVNKHGRPTRAILLLGFIIFIFSLIITNKFVLNSLSNLGMLSAFSITLISLFVIYKTQRLRRSLIRLLFAFASMFVLIFYSWNAMGPSVEKRIVAVIPLVIATLIGFIMFKIKNNGPKTVRRNPSTGSGRTG
jgi:amino acid transporter